MNKARFLTLIFVALWLIGPMVISHIGQSAKLETIQSGKSGVVNYFVAGLLNQPAEAFKFLTDHPALEGDTIVVATMSNFGVDYEKIFDDISSDAKERGFEKVRIFGISVGCAVTYDANLYGIRECEVECYEINPCWTRNFLKPFFKERWVPFALFGARLADFVIGPLKFIPVIAMPDETDKFSVHLMMTQLERILLEVSPNPGGRNRTKLVVLSAEDEFLDNSAISDFYGDTPTITLEDVAHGRTIVCAEEYAKAFENVLK